MTDDYSDIINLPRPVSKTRMPMSLRDRAAQFAPFAALTGYDEAIGETARLTDSKHVLSDEEARELNQKLRFPKAELAQRKLRKPSACNGQVFPARLKKIRRKLPDVSGQFKADKLR